RREATSNEGSWLHRLTIKDYHEEFAMVKKFRALIAASMGCDQAKLARAAVSLSKVGMASTRRVTVRASRTRPGPQTRRSTLPSRASWMEMRTRVERPELSICGALLSATITLRVPFLRTDCSAL